METENGKSLLHGIAYGTVRFISSGGETIENRPVADTALEWDRFQTACEEAHRELDRLYDSALKQVGESHAQIFRIHQMMLEDEDFLDAVRRLIEQEHDSAAYAVYVTGQNFSDMFEAMDNEYMRARAADVRDVAARLSDLLTGRVRSEPMGEGPFIIVAEDLSPEETVQFDKTKIAGFVTRGGSAQSHTAILARTMNLPALIGVARIDADWDGHEAFLDGYNGFLCVDPTPEIRQAMLLKMEEDRARQAMAEELRGKEDVTPDGHAIKLYANIGGVSDVGSVLENDAQGVGLFRTEFLYLGRRDYPGEEEQFQIYKKAASTLGSKKLIIRTLDVGADKQADYFGLEKEANPALGVRAIRLCFARPQLFITQLRAILRAAVFGNIAVMFPMIVSEEEVMRALAMLDDCRDELEREGIKCRDVERGIMIETPAAVMVADRLAELVDFFSIGTNDLVQYTLAADRQNPRLESLVNTPHPAVFRMIRQTVEAGHRAGIWVGVCGEMASDPAIVPDLIRAGVDELSVVPGAVLDVRRLIRETRVTGDGSDRRAPARL